MNTKIFDYPSVNKVKYEMKLNHFNFIQKNIENYRKFRFGDQDYFLAKNINQKKIDKETTELINIVTSDNYWGLRMYRDSFLISEAHSTLNIEGINSTRKELEAAFKAFSVDEKIEGIVKSLNLVDNYIEEKINLTLETLQNLYSVLTHNGTIGISNDEYGEYFFRVKPIYIVESKLDASLEHLPFWKKGDDPKNIISSMNELINFFNEPTEIDLLSKVAILHLIFVKINPYIDGSGKIARLLIYWFQAINWKNILKNFQIEEYKYNAWRNYSFYSEVVNSEKKNYYKAIEDSLSTFDLTYFCIFHKLIFYKWLKILKFIISYARKHKEKSGRDFSILEAEVLRIILLYEKGKGIDLKTIRKYLGISTSDYSNQFMNKVLRFFVKLEILFVKKEGKGNKHIYYLTDEYNAIRSNEKNE